MGWLSKTIARWNHARLGPFERKRRCEDLLRELGALVRQYPWDVHGIYWEDNEESYTELGVNLLLTGMNYMVLNSTDRQKVYTIGDILTDHVVTLGEFQKLMDIDEELVQ